MAPGDVGEQCAVRRGRGRQRDLLAKALGGREAAGEQPDGGGFHIPLAPGDLARETQARRRFQPQDWIEQLWRVEEGVAMQPTEPGKLRAFEPRDGAEDAGLLTVLELGLEADHVE